MTTNAKCIMASQLPVASSPWPVRWKIDKQAALSMKAGGDDANNTGFSTVVAIDLQLLCQCVLASYKVAQQQSWTPEEQADAAIASSAPISTRLSLALRSSVWLKNQMAELTRQGKAVGDRQGIFKYFMKIVASVESFGLAAARPSDLALTNETRSNLKLIPDLFSSMRQVSSLCVELFQEKSLDQVMADVKDAVCKVIQVLVGLFQDFVAWLNMPLGVEVKSPGWWQPLRVLGGLRRPLNSLAT
jgi:hypothetical protein